MPRSAGATSWYELACAFVDLKWSQASPRHRKSIAEALVAITVALSRADARAPEPAALRSALMRWSFNAAARTFTPAPAATPPAEHADAFRWISRHSLRVADLAQPLTARKALDAVTRKLDGSPAASATVSRMRSALYSALAYAVELKLLSRNPLDGIRWTAPVHTDAVDRRVVVNPEQAAALLAAVRRIYPTLEAFYGCM